VILPLSLLEEYSTLPPQVASPHGALERDLLGRYTGLDIVLESRLNHWIVQRRLTPRLKLLVPALELELIAAVDEHVPTSENWVEFEPYQAFGKVAAKLAARAIVGLEFCYDPTWLDVSVNYTENCKYPFQKVDHQ
jgi:ent-kaurene oxidase